MNGTSQPSHYSPMRAHTAEVLGCIGDDIFLGICQNITPGHQEGQKTTRIH